MRDINQHKHKMKKQRHEENEENNIGYDLQYSQEDGGGIKCKNYEICGQMLPTWLWKYKGMYLCSNCHMMFGTWGGEKGGVYKTCKGLIEIRDNLHYQVYLEAKRSVPSKL